MSSAIVGDATAANRIKEDIIRDEDARYTGGALQEPVHIRMVETKQCQDSLYFDFMTEYNLLLEETNGALSRMHRETGDVCIYSLWSGLKMGSFP